MSDLLPRPETRIALFQQKEIRRTIHNNEWWFVIEDVVQALADSADPKQYIQRMKQRDPELAKGWVQIVHTLAIQTAGGPQRMLCANTEGIFRLIQSIPSRKAEPCSERPPPPKSPAPVTPKVTRRTKRPPTPAAPLPAMRGANWKRKADAKSSPARTTSR